MCTVCLHNPCDFRCPNAGEMHYDHICVECKEGIPHGSNFLTTPEGEICEECIRCLPREDILELCGKEFEIA